MPQTLIEALANQAQVQPNRVAFEFLADGETTSDRVTYRELRHEAAILAWHLQRSGLSNKRALLLFHPGLDFLKALLGCMQAGVIAVPIAPPSRRDQADLVESVVRDCQPLAVLGNHQSAADWRAIARSSLEMADIRWTSVEDLLAVETDPPGDSSDPSTIAYLQYTSGSTSMPKGVIITHHNLISNLEAMRRHFSTSPRDTSVSWLPHFHDMGLVAGLLLPIYAGYTQILMSPGRFAQRPISWLNAISNHRATGTVAPNFAYQLCVTRTTEEDRAALDLSSLRVAIIGAETVQAETLRAFADAFGPSGFDPVTFCPSYGLAEATLFVAGTPIDQPVRTLCLSESALTESGVAHETELPNDSREVVDCGVSPPEMEVLIANPATRLPMEAGKVGEIWIRGPGVSPGFWNRPGTTIERLRAKSPEEPNKTYLRTGDLGSFYDGGLLITGRISDLIIIRGINHYPEDIERTVSTSHSHLAPFTAAAFAIEDDLETHLGVAVELKRSHRRSFDGDEICRSIAAAVSEAHSLQVFEILLGRPGFVPRTSSGKIQRYAIAAAARNEPNAVLFRRSITPGERRPAEIPSAPAIRPPELSRDDVLSFLLHWLSLATDLPARELALNRPFSEFGLDSLQLTTLSADLSNHLGQALPPTLALDYPTLSTLLDGLCDSKTASSTAANSAPVSHQADGISIIGVGCNLAGGVTNLNSFSKLLRSNNDAIRDLPVDRWNYDSWQQSFRDANDPSYPTRGAFLEESTAFDAEFFGIPEFEARLMDPQHRLLLEVSWVALEDAGLVPSELEDRRVGVFLGAGYSGYGNYSDVSNSEEMSSFFAASGAGTSFSSGRISHILGLTGPNLALDTACSSALVALHLACQSLRRGESDLAIVAGVQIHSAPAIHRCLYHADALAPDGQSKPFSQDADGFGRGEGAIALILSNSRDAMHRSRFVYGDILGSAINHDGRSSSLTAPSGQAQREVIQMALRDANTTANSVSYVEAHGTGTPLGDPIELSAITAEYSNPSQPREHSLLVGSSKGKVGHTEAASGLVGVLSVLSSYRAGSIAGTISTERPIDHPAISSGDLLLCHSETPWPDAKHRLAGVSAFGMGGTNAHVILSTPQTPTRHSAETLGTPPGAAELEAQTQLFCLSAKTPAALAAQASELSKYVRKNPRLALHDIAFSLATTRTHFARRMVVIGKTHEDLISNLDAVKNGQPSNSCITESVPPNPYGRSAFLFSGQGSQYVGMGAELYRLEPSFRSRFDECCAVIDRELESHGPQGGSIRNLIFGSHIDREAAGRLLSQTQFTQPALFALEYCLFELWQKWGVKPDYLMGHSIGELVAACAAGVLTLEDGLRLTTARARLMQSLPPGGAMAAFSTSVSRIRSAIQQTSSSLDVAAINGSAQTVVSGSKEEIDELASHFSKHEIDVQHLSVSHGFHSRLMDPVVDQFRQIAETVKFNAPTIPIVSTLTGAVADESIATADYWVNELRNTVRFLDGIQTLYAEGVDRFIEIGPSTHLIALASESLPDDAEVTVLPSLRPRNSDIEVLRRSLSSWFVQGGEVDWDLFMSAMGAEKIPLPTYAFQRRHYWVDGTQGTGTSELDSLKQLLGKTGRPEIEAKLASDFDLSPAERSAVPAILDALGASQERERRAANCHYRLAWELSRPINADSTQEDAQGSWLLLADSGNYGDLLAKEIERLGGKVLRLSTDSVPAASKPLAGLASADNSTQNFELQLAELLDQHENLRGVVCLWGLDSMPLDSVDTPDEAFQATAAVLRAMQLIVEHGAGRPSPCWFITQGAAEIQRSSTFSKGPSTRTVKPEQALIWGLAKTFALEHPDYWGGLVDLDPDGPDCHSDLVRLLCSSGGEDLIALRGGRLYVQRLVRDPKTRNATLPSLVDRSVLITGGLGAIGLRIARRLIERHDATHLVLLSRRGNRTPGVQEEIENLRSLGADIRIEEADISNEARVERLISTLASDRPIAGVIHAAGIAQSGLIINETASRLQETLGAKVWGLHLIDRATRNFRLDFVISFSSISAIWGGAGQGAYAAANAFLDAWSIGNSGAGRLIQSISWGPWAEGGMATEPLIKEFEKRGIMALSPSDALQMFDSAIESRDSHLVVADISWERLAPLLEAQKTRKLVHHLVASGSTDSDGYGQQFGSESQEFESDRSAIENWLLEESGKLLAAHSPDDVSLDLGPIELGMDSLMTLELRDRVRRKTGIHIAARELIGATDLRSLVDIVVSKQSSN